MWRVGYFFHEMAFGLLSVFLPLHVVAMGGSLIDVGIMYSTALLLEIPASFVWGYMCDKTKRFTLFILISFLTLTVLLYFFTLTTNIGLFIALYAVLSILHVAHEAPKNVLISELYPHKEWKRTFALFGGFTKTGGLAGLLLGTVMSVSHYSPTATLLLCSGLNLVAFVVSLLLLRDPPLVFERTLARLERTVDFTYRGVVLATRILDGLAPRNMLKRENSTAFCSGLALFSLATKILSAPLPLFFANKLALPADVVFAIYVLTTGGGVLGYWVSGRSRQVGVKSAVTRTVMFRGVLTLLLVLASQPLIFSAPLAIVVLTLMSYMYSLFHVSTLSLSMGLLPAGRAGVFNVLIGIGGACGSFLGPFLAQTLGFNYTFLTAGAVFVLSYVAFRLF